MPAVMDTHKFIDIEDRTTQSLLQEQHQDHAGRPGWWRILTERISARLTPLSYTSYTSSCDHVLHHFESPMDRLVREHPSWAPYALAII